MQRYILGDHLSFLEEGEKSQKRLSQEKKWPEGRKQESVVCELQGKRKFKETGGRIKEGSRKARTEKGPLDVVVKRSL